MGWDDTGLYLTLLEVVIDFIFIFVVYLIIVC